MKRTTAIITGVALSLGLAGGVAAYGKHGGWHRGEHFIGHVRDELNLTPEQTAALEAARDQVMSIREEVHARREQRQGEILALIGGATLDQTQALRLVGEKTELVNQYAPQVVASLAGFYDSLSGEQQVQLREHIAQHMARHRH